MLRIKLKRNTSTPATQKRRRGRQAKPPVNNLMNALKRTALSPLSARTVPFTNNQQRFRAKCSKRFRHFPYYGKARRARNALSIHRAKNRATTFQAMANLMASPCSASKSSVTPGLNKKIRIFFSRRLAVLKLIPPESKTENFEIRPQTRFQCLLL